MTAKSSIDPAAFLHEHLSQASPDLLRELMQSFVNTLLSAVIGLAVGAIVVALMHVLPVGHGKGHEQQDDEGHDGAVEDSENR